MAKRRALRIHAGPRARRHLELHGLRSQDVSVVPGAAGLAGASIGAWRLGPRAEPGRKSPTPRHVSERFAANLGEFYGGRVRQVLATGRGPLSWAARDCNKRKPWIPAPAFAGAMPTLAGMTREERE